MYKSKLKKKTAADISTGYLPVPTFAQFKEAIMTTPEATVEDVRGLFDEGLINQSQMEELMSVVTIRDGNKNFKTAPYDNMGYYRQQGPLNPSQTVASVQDFRKNKVGGKQELNKSLKRLAVEFLQMQNCDTKTIQFLDDAIEHQTKVQIQYGEGGTYFAISPFAWHSSKEGNPTVKAYDEKGQVKSYTVNKIKNIKSLSNSAADKQKYNENIQPAGEGEQVQKEYDKNYDGGRNKPYDSYKSSTTPPGAPKESNLIKLRLQKMAAELEEDDEDTQAPSDPLTVEIESGSVTLYTLNMTDANGKYIDSFSIQGLVGLKPIEFDQLMVKSYGASDLYDTGICWERQDQAQKAADFLMQKAKEQKGQA